MKKHNLMTDAKTSKRFNFRAKSLRLLILFEVKNEIGLGMLRGCGTSLKDDSATIKRNEK
jgi:hypothetical protein